ncbi:hypothetical protein DFJ58DRAFT_916669 [Suillus subalutaceus]|uniref:uncharacterized protein n=1 Tax=Suillus subalutaceus TaxID=48586 RepID=UPI001B85BB36|nr:uncharacterized protein DFJ58DRAFT_916669 [Suillus subalutaceus]KAG1840735.1 hypothetical protein DFJ58DRAFT_916669 [Suillus subalutaceus]
MCTWRTYTSRHGEISHPMDCAYTPTLEYCESRCCRQLVLSDIGCPVVFVYAVDTDWPTLGIDNGNRDDEVVAGGRKRRKEDQRKQELENDEYTEDVQPTSVRCRGCQKAISLDKRSRYYPGLWVKHRSKCPGILELEVEDKELTRRRDWFFQLNPEPRPPAASSFDASGENWEEGESEEDEDEDRVMGFSREKGDGRTATKEFTDKIHLKYCGIGRPRPFVYKTL